MAAPVTVIIAWDTEIPRVSSENKLFPHAAYAVPLCRKHNRSLRRDAFRQQFISKRHTSSWRRPRFLGARLRTEPVLDAAKLNVAFFQTAKWKVNLLCNLGYGDPSKLPSTQLLGLILKNAV